IIIGAGPVGETLAGLVAAEGLSTAIVEHDLVGGECAYYACKPSKALLRPIEVAANTQHLQGIDSAQVVPEALLARRDALVSHYDDSGQKQTLEAAGITVIRGHGRLNGERSVEVHGTDGTTQTLRADRAVVITTGTTANIPPVFEGVAVWDSQDATAVQEVAELRLLIGGRPGALGAADWIDAVCS